MGQADTDILQSTASRERPFHRAGRSISKGRLRGMAPAANGHVVINATHESLAARFGVSRPRLSKELKRLEAAGMVKLGRGTLEITDTGWFEAASW